MDVEKALCFIKGVGQKAIYSFHDFVIHLFVYELHCSER